MGVGAGLYMYVVVLQKFTFAISSPDEFLLEYKLQYMIGWKSETYFDFSPSCLLSACAVL